MPTGRRLFRDDEGAGSGSPLFFQRKDKAMTTKSKAAPKVATPEDDKPKTAKPKPQPEPTAVSPTQADLDAMKAGTFRSYSTR